MALGRSRRRRAMVAALAALPALAGCGLGGPGVVPVVVGTATAGASATGTLEHITEAKIGFPQGGRLTSIKVKVGDKVTAGEPVAEVENLEQKMALRKAQDQAQIEQIKLDQANANNKAKSARQETQDNEKLVADAQRAVEETDRKNQDTIKRTQKKLDFDRDEVALFQERLDADRACLQDDSDIILPGIQVSQECYDRLRTDRDNLAAARDNMLQARIDLETAKGTLKSERADHQLSQQEKVRDRNVSRNNADFEQTDKPFNVEAQRLTLDAAQADLTTAQKAFQDTIKPSMYSGTVDHINGQVGQVLISSYSLLGPGGGPAPRGPAADEVITLKDVDAYQVVVPFSESDGSRITPDKTVDVTFDEIPGLVAPAHIASIEPPAPNSRSKSYLATVVLNQNDPRLKDGMQARATVALDSVDNALVVPTDAVRVNGRTGMVTLVPEHGSRREVSVELGLVGERTVEILSGLRENDKVVARHD